MDKKEYLVGVTIIEGRNLRGKDSSGTSDPFVKIKCAYLDHQVSMKKYKANTVVWNQSFTFSQLFINQFELETFELIIEVYDYNSLMVNELIGYHSIGLSTLYRNLNHEFYKVWLTLFNPDSPNEIQGYLQISCFIVGQNERPPAHSQDENALDDEEEIDEDAFQGLSEEQKMAVQKRKQGIFLLQEPNIIKKGYQLSVNILKAEDLPQCDSSGTCNSFVSVRAVGAVQTTKIVEENYNPIFNSRLCFPVFIPFLNDKITVRVWSQGIRSADTFIGNIPEYPSAYDFFNISKVLSCDGKMRATWFNLYGTHPLERGWFQSSNTQKKEGSSYLGRVLVQMNLVPNDKPQLFKTLVQPSNEPQIQKYMLWIDSYDLVNCDEAAGNNLWIITTVGSNSSIRYPAKYRESTNSYTWPKISFKTMSVDFPQDLKQVPDIIINVYSEKTFTGEYRLGYIRVPVKDCCQKNPNPQWYRMKSPLNDKTCPGIILMNIQFIWEGADIERFPKQRGVEGSYKLFAQIFSGFEIAPSHSEEILNTKLEIRIGNQAGQKDNISVDPSPGRYPQWNKLKIKENIILDKNLSFAPDMRIILYNCTKTLILRREQQEVIGEFCVPLKSIKKKLYSKPQYFNFINNEGLFQGQVLARFYLKTMDLKRKKDDMLGLMEEFNSISRKAFKANIKISLVGIRNLIYFAKRPVITLKLTGEANIKEETFKIEDPLDTRNPNFGKIIEFQDVELPFEPLLWPYLLIGVKDEGNMFGLGGCEQCYTTISLFEYADFLRQEDINFAKAQMNKNQNKICLVQRQIDPNKFYSKLYKNSKGEEDDEEEELKNSQINVIDSDDENKEDQDDDDDYGINQVGGMRIKEFDHSRDEDDDAKSRDDDDDEGDNNGRDQINHNEIDLRLKKDGAGGNSSLPLKKDKLNGKKKAISAFTQDGAHIDLSNIIEINCSPHMKQEEEKHRQTMINELEKQCDKLMLQIQWTQNREKKEEKKSQLVSLKNKIQELMDERMNENKFWGYVMDEQEEFQYGRDVLKEGTYETFLNLPYGEFPLFTHAMAGGKTAQVGGMLRSGQLTGATLKAAIRVVSAEDDGSEDSDDSEADNEAKRAITAGGVPTKTPKDAETEEIQPESNEEEDKALQLYKKILDDYPYDISIERFLKSLVSQRTTFKIRVYLLTCQNLTAIDSFLDLKSKLAGLKALCSADPFPVVIVGDGKNDTQEQKVKCINERDKEMSQNLNPKFYRSYEFDASFPEDWKVELQIYDKGSLSYTDALIGSTIIDLEDRYFGCFRKQVLETLEIRKDMALKIINQQENKEKPDKKLIFKMKKKIEKIGREQASLNTIEEKPLPVEFRELRHPNKQQAQGLVEMWVEVLTQEQARRTPMARLQVQTMEEYELRLIVWETRDIPLVNGGSVDIYCKVLFDPTGWSGGEIERKTDIHYGSKDGRGVFNYRLKFNIETPCEFPRLKFQIYDYGLVGDESIGEAILNLKKTIGMLQKEGRLEVPKTWLAFTNPNTKSQDCGQVLVSFSVLPKVEADNAPVGEAQEEPNENPKLEKPSEGRGIGDQLLAATGFDVGKLKLPSFNIWRNFIIFGLVETMREETQGSKKSSARNDGKKNVETQGSEKKKKAKTIEEQLAELESDDSELERLRKKQNKKSLFNDKQWKIIVGIIGSCIMVGLIVMTLNIIARLLSGGN